MYTHVLTRLSLKLVLNTNQSINSNNLHYLDNVHTCVNKIVSKVGVKHQSINQSINSNNVNCLHNVDGFVWFMVFYATFNKYFSYIVALSFIGGGNWSTWRKPLTCRKSLTNFIT